MDSKWKVGLSVGLAVALLLGALGLMMPVVPEEAVERGGISAGVYHTDGGDKLVVQSGGELEIQSGGTFDLQSGATIDFSSGVDLDGAALTIDADGDTSLVATTDDIVTVTLGAATGRVDIATGNLRVGDGTPGETHNGEDFYVEGISEFDGSAYFDGAVDFDGSVTVPGGYLLAYATTGYELVCSTSGTFTETTTIAVTGLTTVTYAIVTQITDPASTGAFLTVDTPTTSTLTINSWETDATVGTTGVNVYYCAVGTQ